MLPDPRGSLLRPNQSVQLGIPTGILRRHRATLPRNSPTHHPILWNRNDCPPQMERWYLASPPNEGGSLPRMPPFTSVCVICCRPPPCTHRQVTLRTSCITSCLGDDGHGGISHLLSYVNDKSTCVYLDDLQFLCETLKSRGALLGCFVNTSKTRILTSCNGTSPVDDITALDVHLGASIYQTIAQFSNKPNPTDQTQTIPVELTDGCRLLGHPIGSA